METEQTGVAVSIYKIVGCKILSEWLFEINGRIEIYFGT
jgi:hypothetical protein